LLRRYLMPPTVGRYWILTVPHEHFTPYLPDGVQWIKGQLERGDGGYLHWQFVVAFPKNVRLSAVRGTFGPHHAELTRSERAVDYCSKSLSAVVGTQFELGVRLVRRNDKRDWESVWESAKSGDFDAIDASLRVQHYRGLKQIAADHLTPLAMERNVFVFWGVTGAGKSRRAWAEAGLDAYPKDPRTKFWCGYGGQPHVVIDEFRGGIDVAHLLRWLDRYPVTVETKGSATVLRASRIWITSNIPPEQWFPVLDPATMEALLRRIHVFHFPGPLAPPP